MNLRVVLAYAVAFVLVILVGSLLVGQALGTPIGLAYVETDSMEPTLEPGDGYVAIPAAVAGPVEQGDVVTFDADQLHGGELTTHRVVGETDEGYITRGDANPFTDQDGEGEPPVTDGQVEAKALQVGGEVVVIPHLGTAVMGIQDGLEAAQFRLAALLGTGAVLGTQGLAYIAFALGAGILLWGYLGDRGRRTRGKRSRSRSRKGIYDVRLVVIGLVLVVCLATVGTMAAASGTEEYGIVSAEFESDRPDVIPQGETETVEFPIENGGVLPMVAVLEPASDGTGIEPREHYLTGGESVEASLSLSAPSETGYYVRSVSEHYYFAVLPPSVILSLHAVHPWLATGAVTVVIASVFALPLVFLVGLDGTVRTRSRTRG